MKISQSNLIAELFIQLARVNGKLDKLQALPANKLMQKADKKSWNALECLEHLAKYGDFYLPEIKSRIDGASHLADKETIFKSGVLGNYFANSMLPKSGDIKKMQTFKNMNPIYELVAVSSMDRFLKQMDELEVLLKNAEKVDLTKIKTAISISKFIQIRLGDTFRFFLNHIERHVDQALRAAIF